MGEKSTTSDFFQYIKHLNDQLKIDSKNKETGQGSVVWKDLLEAWLLYLRELLLFKLGVGSVLENNVGMLKTSNKYSVEKLIKIINTIQNMLSIMVKTSINYRFAFEIVALDF